MEDERIMFVFMFLMGFFFCIILTAGYLAIWG